MNNAKGKITDAVAILHRLYVGSNPAKQALLEEERANMEIARKIFDLRRQSRLTQRQLPPELVLPPRLSAVWRMPIIKVIRWRC